MNIAILGYGREGHTAYDYWSATGDHEITICDRDEQLNLPPHVRPQLGANYLGRLERFDLIVRSPGVRPHDIVAANTPGVLDKVTTVTNEFLQVCPSRNIIGVTGTKGKGTTSTLITRLLEADGRRVHLGGNIGVPPLDLLKNDIRADDWVVLELSSFQLFDLKHSPHIAVCLMVVPEHLDWHADTDEYYNAKTQLFRYQTSDDIAIYYDKSENSRRIASTSKGWKVPYMAFPGGDVVDGSVIIDNQIVCAASELKLLGEHNRQNVCAAITAVWKVAQNIGAMRQVLTTFSGLPHRLQLIREIDGVKYYNDSFASVPDATIAALESIPEPKVIIMGGFDRNLPLGHLAEALSRHRADVHKAVLIGASGPRLAGELDKVGFSDYVLSDDKNMAGIVALSKNFAGTGDAVVLSPGFPSFDMFKDFEDRGTQFVTAVNQL